MKHSTKAQVHVNPNLIPMIDIMFLLLLFFMLGADMGHRELETVRLPQAENATKDTKQDKEGRVMIRADAGAPFGLAQRAMNVCAQKGIFKIEVGAAKPKPQ